jgi:glycine betaine transporter
LEKESMKKPTQRIKKILVPVDLSAYSQSTIDYASIIAERFSATLIFLHVIESLPYSVTDTFKVVEHRKGLQTLATSLLRNLSEEMQARKLTVKSRLVWGTASREILSEARREKPDLIVMGTHGRSGLPHAILGSVAEKIVRLSRVPVLTVPLSMAAGGKKRSRSSAGL